MCCSFFGATEVLDSQLRASLLALPKSTAESITEIRLRAGAPPSVVKDGEIYFPEGCGLTRDFRNRPTVSPTQLKESLRLITHNSLYSHINEIMNGFVSLPCGNRAGICGVYRDGKFTEVTSINIRIAHECVGVAKHLINGYSGGSYLLCGPPASGKTTLLRDFVRGLSNGENGRFYKVALIDERFEIAAVTGGVPINQVGVNTDIISGRDKAHGAEAAVRSMSPDILAFDEIGSIAELEAIKNSINCGTAIITTAHIGSVAELGRRFVTRELIASVVDKVFFLPAVKQEPIEINVKNGELCL